MKFEFPNVPAPADRPGESVVRAGSDSHLSPTRPRQEPHISGESRGSGLTFSDAWLDQFRRFWSDHVDALERHLDRIDQAAATKRATPTKRKTRRKGRGANREPDKGEAK